MSKEKVNVIVIVDESGSMGATALETKQAVQNFVNDQKALDNVKVKLEIVTFSGQVRTLYPLNKIDEYNGEFDLGYIPNGFTALYDAIGHTIMKYKESDRKTIITILTDGQENASQTYNKPQVSELIKDVQDNLGWEVIFLAANLPNFDAYTNSLNIKGMNKFEFADIAGARGSSLSLASSLTANYLSTPTLLTKGDINNVN